MAFIDENIQEKSINKILAGNFTDYAMSVIVSRAIPDVRDGLKPVHRRILYAMNALGITSDKPYKKSARIVGDVIGKYHPHGDSSVYEAMVRMAQSWSYRETLVDGHGNFGNKDGDGAAAMRYTEARLSKLAGELLKNINHDTVDFQPNFDEEEIEPTVLPARFPNLLVNGSEGIAVGMSTKIPPHNLKEICQAVINQIDNPNITIEELMEYVKGPDFPTGAMIMGVDGIESAYKTGKGSIIVRGVTEVITKKGKTTIIVKEIPYQVSPEKLVKDIRDIQDDWDNYVKERAKKNSKAKPKGLDFVVKDGVHNLTDKTNKNDTVTIEIELKKNVEPELVLNYLYKHTDLQSSFPMNNLSLVPRTVTKGNKTTRILEPKTLTLKETLAEYIKHQIEVETRKLQYELRKAQERMHRIEGIIKALNKLDETIETIRNAQDTNTARVELIKLLEIDEIQANAILELRLQKLTSFDQDKQREEHKELQTTIDKINEKLSNVELIKNDIKASLQEIIERYGNDRRTEICPPAEDFNAEDLISDDEVVVTLTQNGFIKRTLESTYRTQRRKGIGVNAMSMYEDDFIRHLHVAKNRDTLLFFTNIGRVYRKKVWEIQEAARESRGQNIKLLLELEENEKVQALLTVREFSDEQYLFFATQKGIVKKSKLSDYAHIRRNGIAAITLDNVDRLVGVALTNGDRNITLVTKNGLSITFQEEEVRTVGRTGRGVKGIDLKEKDVVISFSIHEEDGDLFIATNSGYGKRTPLSDFRVQTRGGKGVICTKLTDKNGEVVGSEVVQEDDNLMLITKNGTLMRIRVSEISKFGRNTQGTKIMNLRGSDDLRAIARIADTDDDEEIEAEVDSE